MVKFSKKQVSKKQRRKKQNATRKLKGGTLLTDAQLKDKSIKELFQTLAEKQKKQNTIGAFTGRSNRTANINLLVKKINANTMSMENLTEDAQLAAGPSGTEDQNNTALEEINAFKGVGDIDENFINTTFNYLKLVGGDDAGGGGGGGGGGGSDTDAGAISNDVVQCRTSDGDNGIYNEGVTTVMYNKKTKKISYTNKEGTKKELGVLNVVICGIDEKPVGGARVKGDETHKVFKVYFHTEGHIEFDNTKFSIDITEDKAECKNFIQAMMERQNEILDKSHDQIKKVIVEPSTSGAPLPNSGFLSPDELDDGDDVEFKMGE